jgi:predicted nucleotidyltransferase
MIEELRALVKILEEHKLKYCLIGGMAVLLYGGRASTVDFDFYILFSDENAFFQVLRPHITQLKKLGDSQYKFKFGSIPVDVLLADPHLGEQVIKRAKKKVFSGAKIRVARVEDLILLKKIADRAIDRRDIEELEELYGTALDRRYLNREWRRLQKLLA